MGERARDEKGHFRTEQPDNKYLTAVAKLEPAATTEIADAVGVTRQNADYRLRRLREAGLVKSKTIGNSLAWRLAADIDVSSTGHEQGKSLKRVFDQYPVQLALLFGSQATGKAGRRSDFDIAVAFEGLAPGDADYNDIFFDLYDSICVALGTDDVDLVDLRTSPAALRMSISQDGQVIYGSNAARERVFEELSQVDPRPDQRLRLNAAIKAIDESLA